MANASLCEFAMSQIKVVNRTKSLLYANGKVTLNIFGEADTFPGSSSLTLVGEC